MPDNNELLVDLKQCALHLMCHLDRLATALLPNRSISQVSQMAILLLRGKPGSIINWIDFCFQSQDSSQVQDVVTWGWGTWNPSVPDSGHPFAHIAIKQVAFADLAMLLLLCDGTVLTLSYTSESLVSQYRSFQCDFTICAAIGWHAKYSGLIGRDQLSSYEAISYAMPILCSQ